MIGNSPGAAAPVRHCQSIAHSTAPMSFIKPRHTDQTPLKKAVSLSTSIIVALVLWSHCSMVLADNISPGINNGDKVYSRQKPDKEFFGTGVSGRLSEASYLRFMGEQDLDDGNWEEAVQRLAKAVQLDSGDPRGHILYAKAMTSKFNAGIKSPGGPDLSLLKDCIEEWKLIWHHDADAIEQFEARAQARRLSRFAKAWQKNQELAARNANPH